MSNVNAYVKGIAEFVPCSRFDFHSSASDLADNLSKEVGVHGKVSNLQKCATLNYLSAETKLQISKELQLVIEIRITIAEDEDR